jgi:hypothetical protein
MNRLICAAILASLVIFNLQTARADLLFENSDFELGDLTNWRTEGRAFNSQPTKGDNVAARRPGSFARPQGTWWVGTYENFQGKDGQNAGRYQGNGPRGGLISTSFMIDQPFITFLIGGGNSDATKAQLIVAGRIIQEATGNASSLMQRVYWDVSGLQGQKAIIYIIDQSDKDWGFINVDDFRFAQARPESDLLFPNSDFEQGDLSNWNVSGTAFNTQPTKGDSAAARDGGKKPAEPQGTWWIGTYENYQGKDGQTPGTIQDDDPTGVLRSNPFKITGKVISFRVGGGDSPDVAVRLLVEGEEVAIARGNREERLREQLWDVSEYQGKEAVIEIVDMATRHWGHINADDFRWGRLD